MAAPTAAAIRVPLRSKDQAADELALSRRRLAGDIWQDCQVRECRCSEPRCAGRDVDELDDQESDVHLEPEV